MDCGAVSPSLFSRSVQILKGLLCTFLLPRNLHCVYRTARAEVISLCSYEHLSAWCSDLWKQQLSWLQLRHFETLQMLSLKAVERIFHVWLIREDSDDCVHLLCKKIISFQGNYNTKCLRTRLITVWAQRKEILAAFGLSSLRGSEMDTDILPRAQMHQDLSHREAVGFLGSPALSLIFPTSSSSFQPCRQDMCSSGCYFRTHRLQLAAGAARNHMDLFISLCFNLIFMQRNLLCSKEPAVPASTMGLLSQHGQSDLLSGVTDFVPTRGCQASSSFSFRRYSPNKLVYGNSGGRLPCWRLNLPLKYAALSFWEMQEFQLWRSPWGFLCSLWLSCVYLGLGHTSPVQLEGYVMDADCYLLNVKISDHVTLHKGS